MKKPPIGGHFRRKRNEKQEEFYCRNGHYVVARFFGRNCLCNCWNSDKRVGVQKYQRNSGREETGFERCAGEFCGAIHVWRNQLSPGSRSCRGTWPFRFLGRKDKYSCAEQQ